MFQSIRPRRRSLMASALVFGILAFAAGTFSSSVGASEGCDLVVAPGGSDNAAGTAEAPFRTIDHLLGELRPGHTACLRGDGVFADEDNIKVDTENVTLTSFPGTRATLKGRLWVAADGVTVERLNLDGRSSRSTTRSPTITAADVVFRNNDVTNYHQAASCFGLGNAPTYGRAVRTIIEGNSIHNCGVKGTNYHHGIYAQESDDVVIRDNFIYDNADRGIQLYPDARGTRITGNVIDGNGEGVIFSGKDSRVSNDNVVVRNVIANSKLRWNVESGGTGPKASGNVVRDNCVWAAASASKYYSQESGVQPDSKNFTPGANTSAQPAYVNRSAGNLTPRSGSECDGVLSGSTPAPEPTPDADSGGSAGEGSTGDKGKVRIRGKRVRKGSQVKLSGTTPGADKIRVLGARKTKWRRLAKGGWQKVGKGRWVRVKRLRTWNDGARFKSRIKIAGPRAKKMRIKVAAPGLRASKAIKVKRRR